jgi:hypothetical protein
MHPTLNTYLANALAQDRLREAEKFRRSRFGWTEEPDPYGEVTVRFARPADTDALLRLAERDGRRMPSSPALVAEVGGELLAARSLDGAKAIADPFRPTAHLVELLELRSAHLRDGGDGRRLRWVRPRTWLRSAPAPSRPC